MKQNHYYWGKRVSYSHKVILDAYEAKYDEPVQLNQGRRTLAEQTVFWNNYQRYRRGGPWAPLAAFPRLGAPHIKGNKEHHALDINYPQVDKVVKFYRSLGVPVSKNVIGEPWHMDTLDEAKLIAAAAKMAEADKWDDYTAKEKSWIQEYDKLKAADKDVDRRKVLRREMRKARRRIWRAAQASGWLKHRRRDRYNSLRARTL